MTNKGIDKALASLRSQAPGNEFDFRFIMHCLKDYSSPRSKLTQLIKSKAVIRIKKGLYVFNEPFVLNDCYSLEILANMAYGPSYVSLEWALQKYHMIPEDVMEVTSVTAKKSYKFSSDIARFSYSHLSEDAYAIGITINDNKTLLQGGLIATPEKALTDFLIIRRGKVKSVKEIRRILFEDMRIDEEIFSNLNLELIKKIYANHKHSAIYYLIKLMEGDALNE